MSYSYFDTWDRYCAIVRLAPSSINWARPLSCVCAILPLLRLWQRNYHAQFSWNTCYALWGNRIYMTAQVLRLRNFLASLAKFIMAVGSTSKEIGSILFWVLPVQRNSNFILNYVESKFLKNIPSHKKPIHDTYIKCICIAAIYIQSLPS
jgi:hypothetical protein